LSLPTMSETSVSYSTHSVQIVPDTSLTLEEFPRRDGHFSG